MFKRILKWLGAIIALLVIAFAVFLINLIWFRPWSLNLFYEKVFAEVVFDHPELLSTLGLVEQFGITNHNGKLDDESPAHQQREFDRWKRDLTQLRQYPLDRQSPSQNHPTTDPRTAAQQNHVFANHPTQPPIQHHPKHPTQARHNPPHGSHPA